MDRLHGMKVFEKVADCGSFTAAAEACGMTPQNIAKIIAALEKDIGAQLLNRSTRRQNLTEIGEMYLERARVILADVEETDALVSHFTGEVKGTLRVSVANTFAIYQLSHKLPGWLKENPGIRLDMTVTNREVNLIEEGFDVAVTDEEPPDSSLIRHRISELPIILAASPAYIEAPGPESGGRHAAFLSLSGAGGHGTGPPLAAGPVHALAPAADPVPAGARLAVRPSRRGARHPHGPCPRTRHGSGPAGRSRRQEPGRARAGTGPVAACLRLPAAGAGG